MEETNEIYNILQLIVSLVEKYGTGIYDVFKTLLNANENPNSITKEMIEKTFTEQVTPAYQALEEACSK